MTIPRLPPPPRSPQSRSGWDSASTCRTSPPAVTTSAATRLSHASPNRPPSQPSPPPSVRPARPGAGHDAGRGGEAVRLGGPVEVAEQAAGVGDGGPCARVDPHRAHRREVEHHAAVADRVPGDVVPAAAHRHHEVALAGEGEAAHDVVRAAAADDHQRPPVDHGVEHRAGLVVARVVGGEDFGGEVGGQRQHATSVATAANRRLSGHGARPVLAVVKCGTRRREVRDSPSRNAGLAWVRGG